MCLLTFVTWPAVKGHICSLVLSVCKSRGSCPSMHLAQNRWPLTTKWQLRRETRERGNKWTSKKACKEERGDTVSERLLTRWYWIRVSGCWWLQSVGTQRLVVMVISNRLCYLHSSVTFLSVRSVQAVRHWLFLEINGTQCRHMLVLTCSSRIL